MFLDTSGILAFLDADDAFHAPAAAAMRACLRREDRLVITDWIRLECGSLVQRRLGLEAADDFRRTVLPQCDVDRVGDEAFERLTLQALAMRRRELSLVDLASFDCMRRRGIRRALAIDAHFDEQGFLTPRVAGWPSAPPEEP